MTTEEHSDMNDDVASLVRLAGTSAPVAAERLARVRAAVHSAWREECVVREAGQGTPRRRWLTVAVLLGAAACVVIAFAIRRQTPAPVSVPAPVVVAQIDDFAGPSARSRGDSVISGSVVETSVGTLAMTFASGVHLRLDASSAVRVDSPSDVSLERGAVYVDSPGAGSSQSGASAINIHTPAGLVRDVGTQFEVRLAGAGMRVRVRSGEVRVTNASGVDARVAVTEELVLRSDGSIDRRALAAGGSEWAWAERAAPPFSVEGKTLGAFLDWVSHEGAWTVTFADNSLSETARRTVLHGKPDLLKGLTPADALDVILPTCGLRHHVESGHRVVIERAPSKGAIP